MRRPLQVEKRTPEGPLTIPETLAEAPTRIKTTALRRTSPLNHPKDTVSPLEPPVALKCPFTVPSIRTTIRAPRPEKR